MFHANMTGMQGTTPQGHDIDYAALTSEIRAWARELGFQSLGIGGTELGAAGARLNDWLAAGRHGAMDYMAKNRAARARPAELVPGTLSILSARMNYLPADARAAAEVLAEPTLAYVSRYALGRDYHKLLRARLQRLAERIATRIGPFGYRVFTDSAPVMEVEIAHRAGIGWRGKHTLLLSREAGSLFFLGEIYTDLALPRDPPRQPHCGSCRACLDVCPTAAIVAPYQVDARRCISYLTIEHPGSIPVELRPLTGNRIYGCDDCQLVCPWNRHARPSAEADFGVRNGLDQAGLVELFGWNENEFADRLAGSAIRRIGHERWLRNIAVALGNAPHSDEVVMALRARADHSSALVREHVAWALDRHA